VSVAYVQAVRCKSSEMLNSMAVYVIIYCFQWYLNTGTIITQVIGVKSTSQMLT
jgi:hypothetical protein